MKDSYYLLAIAALVVGVLMASVYSTPAHVVTKITPVGPYPATVAANDLNFVFVTAKAVNGQSTEAWDTFAVTGKELLIVRFNETTGSATFTLDSVADNFNRENDIAEYVIAASEFAVFAFTASAGWKNATGNVRFNAQNTSVQWAVIQLPR